MSTHKGSEGLVKIGSATIAEVTGFSTSESVGTIDDTELSDTAETHLTDKTSWSASVECHYDPSDTAGQVAMTIGASVTLVLHHQGDVSGDEIGTGTATIETIEKSNASGETVKATFSCKGNGALVWSDIV